MIASLLIIPAAALAAFGIFLIGDFMFWESNGVKSAGAIESFERGRYFRLPVVSFIKTDGAEARVKAERISQILYLLSRPKKGDVAPLIYMEGGGKIRLRIYGYLPLAAGGVSFLPLIFALGLTTGKSLAVSQAAYLAIFAALLVGGLAFLKFIYRNY